GLDEEKRLAANFFFSRGKGEIGRARMFFTTIAAQLARSLSEYGPVLMDAIEQHPDISQQGLREQWKHLILGPLSSLQDMPAQSKIVVILIDALDECENEKDA